MADYSELSVLIVDPNPGMRGSLHNMLNQCEITRIEYAVGSGTAIRQLSKRQFDIVLCEYDLGNGNENSGQDGQQLLEDLRHHRLIAPWSIFIMITSEGVYSRVIGAVELAPTDYVLKPFTVDALLQRIRRAVERRDIFWPVYRQVAAGDVRAAIASCREGEQANPRYGADYARLRAELLVSIDDLAEAEFVYQALLLTRPTAWARLGLARCQFGLGKLAEAQQTLTALLQEHPSFMAAYDVLARTLQALGQQQSAKKVLEDAVEISPHMVRRLRHLGEVAYASGDVGAAERAFKQVVSKARYSEFRDPEDHLKLVKTLVKKGDAHQAGNVIRDMERSLRSNADTETCRAIAAGMVQQMVGNLGAAATELTLAVNNLGNTRSLSSGLKLDLVQRCLDVKLDQQASSVMLDLMNDDASGVSMDEAVAVFEQAGRHDLAQGMGEQIRMQVGELLAHAAEKRAQGDLRAALDALNAGLRKAPANMALLPATASAMLGQLDAAGWEAPLADQAAYLIERMRKIDASHPALDALVAQYQHTQRKYGIATSA
ncbi:transcriptional regulator [Duganella sp. Leaf126]|uniref:response regulator n=1 Tax=Duganella sp. Leaf126 TaxID=1736266 RepID=UPI0006F32D54|nr:response regulator [Duganella sp. Leaf126]KQQ32424.1 transcriptional regulator [Duganella sp. Leaf126]